MVDEKNGVVNFSVISYSLCRTTGVRYIIMYNQCDMSVLSYLKTSKVPHPSLDFMNNFLSYPNEYLFKKNDEISSNIR